MGTVAWASVLVDVGSLVCAAPAQRSPTPARRTRPGHDLADKADVLRNTFLHLLRLRWQANGHFLSRWRWQAE